MMELTGRYRSFILPLLLVVGTAMLVARTIEPRSIYDARLTDEEVPGPAEVTRSNISIARPQACRRAVNALACTPLNRIPKGELGTNGFRSTAGQEALSV